MRWLILLLPGGVILWLLVRLILWWRDQQRWKAQSYTAQIQSLRPDSPLPLPAVRALRAQREAHGGRLIRYHERMRG